MVSALWRAASLASGLAVVAFAILSVVVALYGMEGLSNLLVVLIVVSMAVFVIIQVGWFPKDQAKPAKE
jgi:purine-cytosine permease-like protein